MQHLDASKTYEDYGEGLEPVIVRTINGVRTIVRCRDEAKKWKSFFEEGRAMYASDPEYRKDIDAMCAHFSENRA